MPTEKWSVTMLSFLKILGVNNMPQHKWYECLVAVAEAAKTSDTPWAVLQKKYPSGDGRWLDCDAPEDVTILLNMFSNCIEFHIKPRTITINGIEVPEPCRVKPEMGQRYFIATGAYSCGEGIILFETWRDNHYDNFWFKNGRIHLKEEDARKHVEADYAGSRPRE